MLYREKTEMVMILEASFSTGVIALHECSTNKGSVASCLEPIRMKIGDDRVILLNAVPALR